MNSFLLLVLFCILQSAAASPAINRDELCKLYEDGRTTSAREAVTPAALFCTETMDVDDATVGRTCSGSIKRTSSAPDDDEDDQGNVSPKAKTGSVSAKRHAALGRTGSAEESSPPPSSGRTGSVVEISVRTWSVAVSSGRTGSVAVSSGRTGSVDDDRMLPSDELVPESPDSPESPILPSSGRTGSMAVSSGRTGSVAVCSGRTRSGAVSSGRTGSVAVSSGRTGSVAVSSGRTESAVVSSGRTGSAFVSSGRTGSAVAMPPMSEAEAGAFERTFLAPGAPVKVKRPIRSPFGSPGPAAKRALLTSPSESPSASSYVSGSSPLITPANGSQPDASLSPERRSMRDETTEEVEDSEGDNGGGSTQPVEVADGVEAGEVLSPTY